MNLYNLYGAKRSRRRPLGSSYGSDCAQDGSFSHCPSSNSAIRGLIIQGRRTIASSMRDELLQGDSESIVRPYLETQGNSLVLVDIRASIVQSR